MERFTAAAAASGSSCNALRSRDAFATCSSAEQPTLSLRSSEQRVSPLATLKQALTVSQTVGSREVQMTQQGDNTQVTTNGMYQPVSPLAYVKQSLFALQTFGTR